MATAMRAGRAVARAVRSAVATEATDRELLERFAAGDEAAFGALVARYGSLVQGVCRRVLPTEQDAEDATQAIFLILAKKAAGGRWQSSVANWLYTTARMVAAKANRSARRRTKREDRPVVPAAPSALDQMSGREAFAALDAELDRLPPMYREPLVLCHLQGLTRDEAATRLSVPVGTLKTRLERGRKRLADALTKRGIVLGAGLLAVAATSPAGASPSALMASVLSAVSGSPSPAVAALAQGAAVNGFLTRTKVLALAGLVAVGFGLVAVAADPPKTTDKMEKPKADAKAEPKKADEVTERTIGGTVVGPDGKPIQAELTMHWIEGTVQPLGKTNADGRFKLTVPLHKKDMGGELVATAVGCGPDFHYHGYDWLPASVTPTVGLAFKLPKERAIKGRIINQEGKPVAGATVAVFEVSAYDSDASLDARLKKWAERADGNPLRGDRGMQYPKAARPPSTTTDADGRFELAGFGVGQSVQLKVSGDGIATKGLVYVNRDGFDPAPLIETAIKNAGKSHKFNPRWVVCGPGFTAVVEPEKLIRGTVTNHDGKPRAGVRVQATRTTEDQLTDHWYWHEATTDKDGRYVIRGVRKYPAYMVEVDGDPETGQLPLQASAKDSVGYEPITLDAKSVRGVIVRGRVTNKATGRPVRASVQADVMAGNPFVDKVPTLLQSGGSSAMRANTDADGGFRLVTLPGRVVLMVQPYSDFHTEYRPARPDPDHPDLFRDDDGGLQFDSYRRGRGIVQGCWCKLLDSKATDADVTVNVELEPSTKMPVKVLNGDGKPVTGVTATGVSPVEYASPTEFTDAVTVFNLEPKKERVLAVIHKERKLVGTLTLTAVTKDPVVMLDRGGTITGRVVDAAGKPLAGVSVTTRFAPRVVNEAAEVLHREPAVTDANGEFRIEAVFPGQEFQVLFKQGKEWAGLDPGKAPKHTIEKHGDTLKLGDIKLEPSKSEE